MVMASHGFLLLLSSSLIFTLLLGSIPMSETVAQLCTEGILDKANFAYCDDILLRPKGERCALKRYGQSDFVRCIDNLANDHQEVPKRRPHIALVGDSRIRQYYYNLIKFVPDYDRPYQAPANHQGRHVSRDIIFPLLHDVMISFRWLPGLDDKLLSLFRKWADGTASPPLYVLIGITLHHMWNSDGHLILQKGLKDLLPILDKLKGRTRIVWLNQPPTIDFVLGKPGVYVRPKEIYSERIQHFNQVVRETFRNASHFIQVWDSSNHIVEEYVRACSIQSARSADRWLDTWVDCTDYVHPGYAALTQTIQLLLNDLCNVYLQ